MRAKLRHILFAGIRAVILLALLGSAASSKAVPQQTEGLILWLPPTDYEFYPADGSTPTKSEQDDFFDDPAAFLRAHCKDCVDPLSALVKVDNVRGKTYQDPAFARQVLGQRAIFEALTKFIEKSGFTGNIHVRFFEWEDLLEMLEDAGRKEESLPHLTMAPSSWIAYLASKGLLEKLVLDKSQYLPEALATCRYGTDTYYAAPWLVDVRLLFYWKDLFAKAAFDNRDTFEAALGAARQKMAGQGLFTPFALPIEVDWDLLHNYSLLFWGSGGEWDYGTFDFMASEPGVDVIRYLSRLHQLGNGSLKRVKRGNIEEALLQKRVGAILSGPWMLPKLKESLGESWHEKIGLAVPPLNKPELPQTTYIGGLHLGMTRRGAHHPASLSLLTFLTSSQDVKFVERGPALTGSVSAYTRFRELLPNDEVRQTFADAIAHSRRYPALPQWPHEVEAQGNRNELFMMYKHLAVDQADAARADVQSFRRRLSRTINVFPILFWATMIVLVVLGATAIVCLPAYVKKRREVRSLRRQLDGVSGELEAAETHRKVLQDTQRSLDVQLDEAKARLEAAERQKCDLEEERRVAKAERHLSEQEQGQLNRQLAAAEARAESLQEEKARIQDQLIDAKAEEQEFRLVIDQKLGLLLEKRTELDSVEKKPIPRGKRQRPDREEKKEANYKLPPVWQVLNKMAEKDAVTLLWPDDLKPSVILSGTKVIGRSAKMRPIADELSDLAGSKVSFLIRGETGSGKDVVARAVHEKSGRSNFVMINCGAIPSHLMESELFGHVKGAFTGAVSDKIGKFQIANGGTIFLNEIGDLPSELQVKLLSVLDTGTIPKVGATSDIPVDVRVIAATNLNLEQKVTEGSFRQDLLRRFNKQLSLPPLRDRREDIPLLAEYFRLRHLEDSKLPNLRFSKESKRIILGYSFPNNVGDFANFIEPAIRYAGSEAMTAERDGESRNEIEARHIVRADKLLGAAGQTDWAATFIGDSEFISLQQFVQDHNDLFNPLFELAYNLAEMLIPALKPDGYNLPYDAIKTYLRVEGEKEWLEEAADKDNDRANARITLALLIEFLRENDIEPSGRRSPKPDGREELNILWQKLGWGVFDTVDKYIKKPIFGSNSGKDIAREVYECFSPSVTGLSKNEGAPGAELRVTVTGTRFKSGETTLEFGSDDVVIDHIDVKDDATTLDADLRISPTAHPGDRKVRVAIGGILRSSQDVFFSINENPRERASANSAS